ARALRPEPLEEAPRREARASTGREPAGRARGRRVRTRDLKRVTVDTTVQPKAITIPTDAKLLHAAIQGLNRLARRHGNTTATVLSAHRQAGRDDGGALRPRQAVQPASPPVAPPAHSARADHPRYPP